MVAARSQPTDEPTEGIDTSPSIFMPCVLCTHDQHVADYVRIMVKSGMSLPMGEDQSAPLITEVLSLFSLYSLLIPSSILLLVLLCAAVHSFITPFVCIQALQKIRLANHIHNVAELLHADAMQQLELALMGSPAAKLSDVLSMSLQHQAEPQWFPSIPFHPLTTSSTPSSPPSVPIAGITDTERPVEAKASTSKISPFNNVCRYRSCFPQVLSDYPCGNCYYHIQIQQLTFQTACHSCSQACSAGTCPSLSGSTALGTTKIIDASYVHFSIQIKIVCWCTSGNT